MRHLFNSNAFNPSIDFLNGFSSITFSYNLIFKIIFLIFLILFSIYLLYIEFIYTDKLNLNSEGSLKQSSNKATKLLRDIFIVVIPTGMAYRTFFRDETKVHKIQKELEEKSNEVTAVRAENEALKAQKEETMRTLREVRNELDSLRTESTKLSSLVNKESELMASINNLDGFEKQKKLAEKAALDNEIQLASKQFDQKCDKFEEIIKNTADKNSILSFDFDLQNFLDSLTKEELLAFSGLLLNSLVLSYVVSIILVLYGEYLIKRFDLENKYPKLAKFIQIRRKLQNYYLKLCFVWIFIGILPQICVYGYIILPRLIELLFN